MILYAPLFDGHCGEQYQRMSQVLELSCRRNSPSTACAVMTMACDHGLDRAARVGCLRVFIENARKAVCHAALIGGAADGELLAMFDCDTMVLGDLSPVESLPFQLAFTNRPAWQQWKINTGVYFVRVSEATKAWAQLVATTAIRMLSDEPLHMKWREQEKYGGIHQAAVGCALETGEIDRDSVAFLDCREWNACSGCWNVPYNPRVVHLNGALRDCCFRRVAASRLPENAQRLVGYWREFEKETERCSACS